MKTTRHLRMKRFKPDFQNILDEWFQAESKIFIQSVITYYTSYLNNLFKNVY